MIKNLRIKKETILFSLIIFFSSVIYLFNLTYSDLWIDETFTKKIIEFPISQMLGLLGGDFHPPLYFILLKLFTFITGISDFTIRLFSVLGAIFTLILSYVVGRRIFGKNGALIFCLLILSIPMLASNSHDARMYTWAPFTVTGVFLYSCLYIKTNKRSDLILLGIFTLLSGYMHYYCLIAAFWANLFVFLSLIKKRKALFAHLITMVAFILLYLPWLTVLLSQARSVKNDFYISPLNFQSILSCYIGPFIVKFWYEISSYIMMVIVFGLTFISIYNHFIRYKDNNRLILGLSLLIFNATILTGVIISFTFRPILMLRYIGPIVTMLMVPPAFFFITNKIKVVKILLLVLLLGCGIYNSISASYFSMGPYKQSLEYLHNVHPGVKKIVHVTEITTGPLLEYNNIGNWKHYWIQNEKSVFYTNLNVFTCLHQIPSLDKALSHDEIFCLADMEIAPLNREVLNMILSQSRTIQVDKVVDNKSKPSITISLYLLQYKGENKTAIKQPNESF
jgi:4-amino-4-deoxy-L-arabinose transferase-like glycosyltransferase